MSQIKKPTSQYILVTPEIAEAWLEKNNSNRPIKKAAVKRLCEAIYKNEWQPSTDAIGFNVQDELINGQHRLLAIQATRTACLCLVVTDLPVESYRVLDCGVTRAIQDRVKLSDDPKTNTIISRVIKFRSSGNTTNKPSSETVENYYHEHQEASDWAGKEFQDTGYRYMMVPFQAACCEMFEKNKTKARQFVKNVKDGDNLDKNSPAKRLRDYLLSGSSKGGNSTRSQEVYEKTIYAAKSFLEGKNISRLGSLKTWDE